MSVAIKTGINTDAITLDSSLPAAKFGIKPHPWNRAEFDAVLKMSEGIGRGEHYEGFQTGVVHTYSLAEQLARRVASRHNKNVIFILFGDLGSGKSMVLLSLAMYCAMWLKYLRGKKISDYFTFENVAVIDPEMLKEKLANLVQYGIYLLDDIGPGYDARTFMSTSNRDLNYILQTCRTQNNILLVSAPHGAMLDITIHRVAQYYGEISESHHDQGVTFLKVLRVTRAYRQKKIFYQYQTKGNIKIVRYYTGLPPKRLKDRYDTVRDEQAKIIQERRQKREAQQDVVKPDKRATRVPTDPTVVKKVDKLLEKNNGLVALSDLMAAGECGVLRVPRFVDAAGWELEAKGKGNAKSKYKKKIVVKTP